MKDRAVLYIGQFIIRDFRIGNSVCSGVFDIFGLAVTNDGMKIDEKEALARYRDTSSEAIAVRLRAARSLGGGNQAEFAKEIGLAPTTYNSQETKGRPSLDVLHYLYRNYRVDYNFILYGDFLQLPGDVQNALFASLRAPR